MMRFQSSKSYSLPPARHLGMAPPLRPLPFPAPLPRGVVLPPLPRVLRRLAWLGGLLTENHKIEGNNHSYPLREHDL